MADWYIEPSSVRGSVAIPPSKSHTLRALLFAALSRGISHIESALASPDTDAMIRALCLMGAEVKGEALGVWHVRGFAGKPKVPDDVVDCGNSGLVLRCMGALASLIPHYTVLTGDDSIRHRRPALPLLEALQQLGAFATSSRGDGLAPLLIRGPLSKERASLLGEDSQPVSALLIASAFASHPIELNVIHPGETPWIDLTLHWLSKMGISYQREGYTQYRLEGGAKTDGFAYRVPGDFSSAAFPLAAALITNSELTLCNLDLSDVQGDRAILPLLEQMGARLTLDPQANAVIVRKGGCLRGRRIDVNGYIDALPILAVLSCFAEGRTELVNGAIARKKESDRIASIARELRKMGASVEEFADGLCIDPSKLPGGKLQGAILETAQDHRLALSLAVAALGAKGPSLICGVEWAKKTYPTFLADFKRIGANIKTHAGRTCT